MLHVLAVESGVLREHFEGRGVGGELVVGVVEVRFAVLVECLHGGDLALHFVFDQRIDLVEKTGLGETRLRRTRQTVPVT